MKLLLPGRACQLLQVAGGESRPSAPGGGLGYGSRGAVAEGGTEGRKRVASACPPGTALPSWTFGHVAQGAGRKGKAEETGLIRDLEPGLSVQLAWVPIPPLPHSS